MKNLVTLVLVCLIALFSFSAFAQETTKNDEPVIKAHKVQFGLIFGANDIDGKPVTIPTKVYTDYVLVLNGGKYMAVPLKVGLAVDSKSNVGFRAGFGFGFPVYSILSLGFSVTNTITPGWGDDNWVYVLCPLIALDLKVNEYISIGYTLIGFGQAFNADGVGKRSLTTGPSVSYKF